MLGKEYKQAKKKKKKKKKKDGIFVSLFSHINCWF